jgi:uncharacterized protein YifE (UPF0438 family)
VAQVLREGDGGFTVAGAVDVGERFGLVLVGGTTGEDQGETEENGGGGRFVEDYRERLFHISPEWYKRLERSRRRNRVSGRKK